MLRSLWTGDAVDQSAGGDGASVSGSQSVEVGQQSLFAATADQVAEDREAALDAAERFDPEAVDYRVARTTSDLDRLVLEVAGADVLAIDTETTSRDSMWASLVGLSLSWTAGTAAFVPTPLPDGTPTEQVLEKLRSVLEGPAVKIGQNIKYDIVVLSRSGIAVGGRSSTP